MKNSNQSFTLNKRVWCVIVGLVSISSGAIADELTTALTSGKPSADFNLRYESVEQENGLKDASALTLRTRLAYTTGKVSGWSALVEMEDTRIVLGQGDYSVPQTAYQSGVYSVIADPEHTELDQGFVQYTSETITAKIGRQVIAWDGQRFIGHVGWRQDRQTFDAVSVKYNPRQDLTLNYAYITQRNRIFAEAQDQDSKDHLFNASFKTRLGTLTGYGYVLELDNETENDLDTFGVSFVGSAVAGETKLLYSLEYANQTSQTVTTDFSADYMLAEFGAVMGGITAKLGYESLGSDDAAYGFSTPLATLHKFNGWADIFLTTPAQGLVDTYISLAGGALGGKWMAAYHSFEADNASDSVDDLGSELDLQYVRAYGPHYSIGLKYAAYSGDSGKVDTDKLWAWLSAKF
ncbi:alginate export family protein [Flavobacterium sp. W21_SRS_FM6]|uniref:alginate export family protein n=1 Tax=Flavobacterium sp. W21_SRS_FM6 TaxID=3240268 RepID=UPI003F90FC31